jgi:hypothetical protein
MKIKEREQEGMLHSLNKMAAMPFYKPYCFAIKNYL